MSEVFDPYHRWLGIAPKDQPPNHYRLLAIDLFESDSEVIRDAAEQRIAHVRTYQLGQHAAISQQLLNELATAKSCLLDPDRKSTYDAELRSHLASPVPNAASTPPPPKAAAALPHPPSVANVPHVVTFAAVAGAVLLVSFIAWALSGERAASPVAVEPKPSAESRPETAPADASPKPSAPESPPDNKPDGKPQPTPAPTDGTEKPPAPAIYSIHIDPVDATLRVHGDKGQASGSGAQRTVTVDRPDLHPYVLLLAECPGCETLETWLTPTAGLREDLHLSLAPSSTPPNTTTDTPAAPSPRLLDVKQQSAVRKGCRAWHKGLLFSLRMNPNGDGTGFACVGFELANVRRVRFDLQEIGELQSHTTWSFFGFIVDYHTADGYTQRVAICMGLGSAGRTSPRPFWGQRVRPSQFVNWSGRTGGELDLALWAPIGWDHQAWISPLLVDAGTGANLSGQLIVPGLEGANSTP